MVHQTMFASDSFDSTEMTRRYGGVWVETNPDEVGKFADTRYTYDPKSETFIPPKPYDSWIFDEAVFSWTPPTEPPDSEQRHTWNEQLNIWEVSHGD